MRIIIALIVTITMSALVYNLLASVNEMLTNAVKLSVGG